MGLGSQLLKIDDLAMKILESYGRPKESVTKKKAKHIVIWHMEKVGILLSQQAVSMSVGDSFVYIVQQDGGDNCVKIGKANNVNERIKSLQTGSPYKLNLLAKIPAKDDKHALYLERSFHERLRKFKLNGEWFMSESLRNIKSLCH